MRHCLKIWAWAMVRYGAVYIKDDKDMKVELKKPLIVLDDPRSIAAEQYRILCAKIQQISDRKSFKTFAITSALKGEGKTTTSLNLAYIMAHEFKKKVLLIDGDMRHPSTPSYMEIKKGHALIDILRGNIAPAATLISLNNGNLSCIPSVISPQSNPAEFLTSPEMKRLIDSSRNRFDCVIIDCPPILPVVDMNILAEIVDGVLLVVKADKTPKDLVMKALKSLTTGEVVGLVLNNANVSSKKYYYKY
ncbi:MAG: CpsD/CapB family tyrosine-protein kinase [Thermodesulfobacteriota bacterium]